MNYFQQETKQLKNNTMITEVNSKMVLILPDAIEEKTSGGILVADVAKEKLQRQQNRGTVVLVGNKCDWAKNKDYLSFYRGAGTDIKEDGIDYILIHEDHCLAKIESNEKK